MILVVKVGDQIFRRLLLNRYGKILVSSPVHVHLKKQPAIVQILL